MKDKTNLIKVYSGSEITVNLLKDQLEKEGIATTVHNESEEAATAGFAIATPYSVDLLIMDYDLTKAEPIITEFVKINKIQ